MHRKVFICVFPKAVESQIDRELEDNMEHLLEIVVMGRACRNTANIKNRQPIANMYVKSVWSLSKYYKEIIQDELNVKEVTFTDEIADFITYSFKPQLKTVGPKYGKMLNGIRTALTEIDGNAAMQEIRSTGELKLDIAGEAIVLLEEDLLIETAQMEGYISESDNSITVVLDTNLHRNWWKKDLYERSSVRFRRCVKRLAFEVMDKIKVYVKDNDVIKGIAAAHKDEICGDVLAEDIVADQSAGYEKSWNINLKKLHLQ